MSPRNVDLPDPFLLRMAGSYLFDLQATYMFQNGFFSES